MIRIWHMDKNEWFYNQTFFYKYVIFDSKFDGRNETSVLWEERLWKNFVPCVIRIKTQGTKPPNSRWITLLYIKPLSLSRVFLQKKEVQPKGNSKLIPLFGAPSTANHRTTCSSGSISEAVYFDPGETRVAKKCIHKNSKKIPYSHL